MHKMVVDVASDSDARGDDDAKGCSGVGESLNSTGVGAKIYSSNLKNNSLAQTHAQAVHPAQRTQKLSLRQRYPPRDLHLRFLRTL